MILDHKGQPFKVKGYSHAGASYQRKSLSSWHTASLSPDDDITLNLDTLRARSRDLQMASPLANGALKTIRTNVVGSGLAVSPHIDYKFLRLNEDVAKEWEINTLREWNLWAETHACDAGRTLNFYQLQALVLFSALLSGDCFVALPYIPRVDNPYSLKVYVIESDRICNPLSTGINNNLLEGIELGDFGEPIAYYIAKYHPHGLALTTSEPQSWIRVRAFGELTGRRNILHIMPDFERPGQRRGVPLLATVIEAMKQLERYTNAELQAAVISGLFTGFVTTSDGMGLSSVFGDDAQEDNEVAMGNGTIAYLKPGESVNFGSPGRPNTGFGGFVEAICRQIGASLEIPYELLIKHFTASYSASRASLLEAWKMFRMRRQWLINSFCQPIYEEFLAEAVAKGRINAPFFFDDIAYKKAWSKAEWAGDAQGQLDPQKEANAAVTRITNGLSTREKEAAELTGLSFDTIATQLKRENDLLGLQQDDYLRQIY